MSRLIYCILLSFSATASFSQSKEDVYLKYYGGYTDYCLCSAYRDGRDKKIVSYKYKFGGGYFVFCGTYFEVKPHTQIDELTQEEVSKRNVVKIDYLLRKREPTQETQLGNPNALFHSIHILVPYKADTYLCFDVSWEDWVPME